jgi:hypothetical protein
MKQLIKSLTMVTLLAASIIYLSGCSDDPDPGPQLTGVSKEYALDAKSNSAISGTVTFAKRDDNSTLITVQLNGTQSGGLHPAHIHANTAAESGAILLDLSDIDGSSGKSETVVTALNDGTDISYEMLLDFDGYVNVHSSSTDLATLIAQGDVGVNELTSTKKVYNLDPKSDPDISGTATFTKRVSGETLVSIELTGTTSGVTSPSHIHVNTAAEGGAIMIDLTPIDGATGKSLTSVSKLNGGAAITYDELLDYNGYINVHLSSDNLGTLIAQGDIGDNELTGISKTYTLNEKTDPAISGTATFAERKNGQTLITLSLQGTTDGGDHPAHMHANNAATGGGIVLDLVNVTGATGKSLTSVSALNDQTAITYDQLIDFNGYINVHLSDGNLATLIAQGDIGSNAP